MHQQWKKHNFSIFRNTWIQNKIPPLPLYYVIVWSIQQINCITQGHSCSIPTFRYYEEVFLRHSVGLHSLVLLAGPNDTEFLEISSVLSRNGIGAGASTLLYSASTCHTADRPFTPQCNYSHLQKNYKQNYKGQCWSSGKQGTLESFFRGLRVLLFDLCGVIVYFRPLPSK